MVDDVQQTNEVSSDSVTNSPSITTPEPVKEQPTEKMLKQSEVNDLVGHVKREAYDKARREAAAEYERKLQQHTQQNQSIGGMTQEVPMTKEALKQVIEEHAQQKMQEEMVKKIQHDFWSKIESARSKDPEYDSKIRGLDVENTLTLGMAQLFSQYEKMPDMLVEFNQHPSKFANILSLALINPNLAKKELDELSNSIKNNELATKAPKAAEPLSQVKPSNTGADNGSMSIRDLRKQSWLRG